MTIPPAHFTGALEELATRAADLRRRRSRVLLGIAGAPGSGKSTLSGYLADRLGDDAVVVPFDGFHLAWSVIAGTELELRRGAIDTFDLGGYLRLLERVRAADEDVVFAPAYRREIEDPVAAAVAVLRRTPVVITEGNYLLADDPRLERVRALLDEVWYVEISDDVRVRNLIRRHMTFGKSRAAAIAWATGSDERNARLIRSTRDRADLIVRLREEDLLAQSVRESASPHVESC